MAQIRLALDYIEENREQVLRDYEAIRARHARGNSAEVRERLERSRARLEDAREVLRRRGQTGDNGHAEPAGGH